MDADKYNSLAEQLEYNLNQAGTLITFKVSTVFNFIELHKKFHQNIPLNKFVVRATITIAKEKLVLFRYISSNDEIGFVIDTFATDIKNAILEPDKFQEVTVSPQ